MIAKILNNINFFDILANVTKSPEVGIFWVQPVFLANVTSVTLIGWKMASLHVQFHCTKIIPRPAAQVARISLRLLRAVLPRERLK